MTVTISSVTIPWVQYSYHEDELCVKVWNWDNRWKVEYYEDGKLKGEMKQYKGMDPDYDFFLQRKAVTEERI